jgi:23S rRNA (uracil1939-C5)-methyltransferase
VKPGQQLEIAIENFASEGKCVGHRNGFVILVSGAVPGDTALIQIQKVKRNFATARSLRILQPSPLRTSPPCKYFGVCGGCTWQHAQYEAQLLLKRQNVIDAFERIGGFKGLEVAQTLPASETYFYRNKIEFSFSQQRWSLKQDSAEKTFALGFHHIGRYDKVIDVDACMLQSEVSNGILRAVKEFCQNNGLDVYNSETESGYLRFLAIREGKHTGERMVNLVTFDDQPAIASALFNYILERVPTLTSFVNTINSRRAQIATGELERLYHGPGTITEMLGKYRFRISANSFFQTNTKQAERLFEVAKGFAELQPTDIVFDLYSGAGSLSIYISDAVQKVVGIEISETSVRDAIHNAVLNGVTNCYFLQGDLKERLTKNTQWINDHGPADVILLDPPRSGMHPKVVQRVGRLLPSRIVYVSCNPATQARDIRSLAEAGYSVVSIQPVDLFPQTFHVESVAKLVRKQ